MQDYLDDAEETLSLCDLHIEEDHTIGLEQLSKPNQGSSSSSSSSSSIDQDFIGFSSEEWSHSPENIIFCGKVVSSGGPIGKQEKKSQIPHPFRSNSDSFRYTRLKTVTVSRPSTSRSMSLPNRLASSRCKSRLLVFMFGSGSSKFPTKMEMGDIKSRQLRRQSTTTVSPWADGGKVESGGRKSENKGWWRLVDVLGCTGGYERDI